MKFFKNPKVILVMILIVAFALRVYKLDKVPVSLFADELDPAYHAYSLLLTGKDYHGEAWPLWFRSVSEWRTPFYVYTLIPFVAVYGISTFGVRMPSMILGVGGVWAMYLLTKELLDRYERDPSTTLKVTKRHGITRAEVIALVGAAVLAVSPWDLQYSRIGFDVTGMLFFLLMGLYFFFKSLKNGKWLWVSMVCISLTAWIYSTAKLFVPMLLLFLIITWRKELLAMSKKYLLYGVIACMVIGLPLAYTIITTPQRFDYISVFSDPTVGPEIGTFRARDAATRGEIGIGITPTLVDRLFENKITYVGKEVLDHYASALSASFFFSQGDPDLRQSPVGMGEFYKIDAVAMIAGLVLLYGCKKEDIKLKLFMGFWIIAGVLPSALTRDGGNHATRLMLILPPLIFLIAYGIVEGLELFKGKWKKVAVVTYLLGFLICFVMYLHNYYVHYPWDSEMWWQAGWQQAIQDVKSLQTNYKTVVVSTANEPPWIFFAAWYPYPPEDWQKNFPIGNDIELKGFGKVSHIDKFYFGTPIDGGIYSIGKDLNPQTLYLANAKESNVNFILEPNRVPRDLVLLKAVAFPSGEPAFYLFTGK